MYWPWLILHLILLSSLPAQYTLATTSGFSLAHMNQAASIFHVYPLPPEDSCLPAPLQLLAQGGDQGHRVRECFLFLAQFWGSVLGHWAQLASFQDVSSVELFKADLDSQPHTLLSHTHTQHTILWGSEWDKEEKDISPVSCVLINVLQRSPPPPPKNG